MSELVWQSIAESYALFGSPFVPTEEDAAILESFIAPWAKKRKSPSLQVVVLGVTPRLLSLQWPRGSTVTAFEASPMVIRALWPQHSGAGRDVVCTQWENIPEYVSRCDIVVGDGVFIVHSFPDGIRTFSATMRRALANDGLLAVRCFTRSDTSEKTTDLIGRLLGGESMSIDRFKLRLYLSLQRSASQGIAVREAYKVLEAFGITQQVMLNNFGWTAAAIAPFKYWRDSTAIYTFPSVDEL
jgi:hypothetical protein